MAEEDTFDIDIYGDDTGQDEYSGEQGDTSTYYEGAGNAQESKADDAAANGVKEEDSDATLGHEENSTKPPEPQPPQNAPPPVQQGIKRKGSGNDDRPLDVNATSALVVQELHWWVTEDDVRGWCNKSGTEDEVKEITFSEHKVNGKSKG